MPVCTTPGCATLVPAYGYCASCRSAKNRTRNADPRRKARYGPGWEAERRAALDAQPWCGICFATSDLTVDHDPNGSRNVWCRSCHSRVEAQRRASARS